MDRKGKWQQVFENQNDLFAEFGCGRGQFIITMAEQHPDRNYIGFEVKGSIILRALEKAVREELKNVVFVRKYIMDVNKYFERNELFGIYLNFSDPWPKKRHIKRRLSHSAYLNGYRRILRTGGCIEFKTDNEDLFSFTMAEVSGSGMNVLKSTDDLHSTELDAKYVTTEYEDRFHGNGKKINYCKIQVQYPNGVIDHSFSMNLAGGTPGSRHSRENPACCANSWIPGHGRQKGRRPCPE